MHQINNNIAYCIPGQGKTMKVMFLIPFTLISALGWNMRSANRTAVCVRTLSHWAKCTPISNGLQENTSFTPVYCLIPVRNGQECTNVNSGITTMSVTRRILSIYILLWSSGLDASQTLPNFPAYVNFLDIYRTPKAESILHSNSCILSLQLFHNSPEPMFRLGVFR